MTNQEWFKNLDTYKLLRGLNLNIDELLRSLNLNIGICIFEAIPNCAEPSCDKYSSCAVCITEWLKQERKENEEGG